MRSQRCLRAGRSGGDAKGVEDVAGPGAEDRLRGRFGPDPRPQGRECQPGPEREPARGIRRHDAAAGGGLQILRELGDTLGMGLVDLDRNGEPVTERRRQVSVGISVHGGDCLKTGGGPDEFTGGQGQAGGLGRIETGQEEREAVSAGVVDLVDDEPATLTPGPEGRAVLPAELVADGNVVAPQFRRRRVGRHGHGEKGSPVPVGAVGGMALARARRAVEECRTAVLNDGGNEIPDRQRGLLGHGGTFGESTKASLRAAPDRSFVHPIRRRPAPLRPKKNLSRGIHTRMKTFHEFVWLRMPTGLLLREISELFPKRGLQDVFDRETQRLREKTDDQEALRHLDEFQQIDVVGYIDSALRRSGFHPNELDSLVHDLCVKLLMGGFFRGWSGQSLVARFKVAVRNAISSLRSRSAKRRRRHEDLPDDVASRPQPDDGLIADFRNFLRLRFGDAVVRVLDHRLEPDSDTKELVGEPGLESAYKVKQAVSQLKDAIRMFAGNDPELTRRIAGLVSAEKRTFDRRFGRLEGASGRG